MAALKLQSTPERINNVKLVNSAVFVNRFKTFGKRKLVWETRLHMSWHRYNPFRFFLYTFTMAEQTERSFQKQPNVFLNKKSSLLSSKGKRNLRYTKNIGLGFKTPREAKEAHYIDKKCPFTGNVSIRGRILTGVVAKMKMQRTIVIRRDYLHFVRKYNRFEKRHKNMSVHLSPAFRDVQIGDVVTVGECRPLSKTVRFNVVKVTKQAGGRKSFAKF